MPGLHFPLTDAITTSKIFRTLFRHR